jgi:hypothetical protein
MKLAALRSVWIAAAVLLMSHGARAETINYPANGIVLGWGPADTLSIGQVFTAPQAILDNYSLSVASVAEPFPVTFPFVSQIYLWNASTDQVMGSALYTSPQQETVLTDSNITTTTTYTANIQLTPGDQYIAFVSNDPYGTSLGAPGSGIIEASSYNASYGVFATQGFPYLSDWYPLDYNLAFTADFSTPLPPSLPLFGAGLFLICLFAKRGGNKDSQAVIVA